MSHCKVRHSMRWYWCSNFCVDRSYLISAALFVLIVCRLYRAADEASSRSGGSRSKGLCLQLPGSEGGTGMIRKHCCFFVCFFFTIIFCGCKLKLIPCTYASVPAGPRLLPDTLESFGVSSPGSSATVDSKSEMAGREGSSARVEGAGLAHRVVCGKRK